jgi:hypothetical protein
VSELPQKHDLAQPLEATQLAAKAKQAAAHRPASAERSRGRSGRGAARSTDELDEPGT